jgi:hypothetical protein
VNDASLAYSLVVSRGYVRLVRTGERRSRRVRPLSFVLNDDGWHEVDRQSEIEPADLPADEPVGDIEWGTGDEGRLDPELELAIAEAMHPRRGDTGQSARSRMNMRRLFVSLPWELVGPRPALVSLTYPGVWQPWVPDGRVWEAHRRAFERRWVRRWGEPLVGVWGKEFQNSGRPHLHLYIGLPTSMAEDDFVGLRERTVLRHRLEGQYGRYQGRRATPPVAMPYGGDFGRWLRDAWSEIVGTSGPGAPTHPLAPGGDPHHHVRDVDVAVMFWSDETEAVTDRTRVAQYLAREAGKWAQKQPPSGFVKVGRFYGVWGKAVGFVPDAASRVVEPAVALEIEARLSRWVTWRLHVLRRGAPPATGMAVRRGGDGITAFGLGPDQAARIVRGSENAVARRSARDAGRVGGGEASVDPLTLLQSLDRAGDRAASRVNPVDRSP